MLTNTAAEAAQTVDENIEAQPADMYGEAKVLSLYNETDYEQPITVTIGARRESLNWNPVTMPLAALIGKLCTHEEGPKDGPALSYADIVPGQRLKNAVRAVTGLGLDIDTGVPVDEIDAKLKAAGFLSIRYTTHSHGTTQTEFRKDQVVRWFRTAGLDEETFDTESMRRFCIDKEEWHPTVGETVEFERIEHTARGIMVQISHAPISKNRIIVPLAAPYVVANEGKTQKEALTRFSKLPAALAKLLGVPFDPSCVDPSRLFYLPRHARGRAYSVSLNGGPLLDWKCLSTYTLDDAMASLSKGGSKSKTEGGKRLGKWSHERAHGFQITQVIDDHCPDKIRGSATSGFTIECPMDEGHSNPGDTNDTGCYAVNAAEGSNELFITKCQHGSCVDYTNLDMLGKMIEDEWFPEEVIWDEAYNIVELDEPKPDSNTSTNTDTENSDSYGGALEFEAKRGAFPKGVSFDKETKAVHPTWRNALLLTAHEKWDLGYNELTQNYGLRGDGPFPWPEHLGYALNDSIRREIRLYLLRRWGVTFKTEDVMEAVMTLARRNAFNPVCDELAELEAHWDGISRVDRLFETYFGAKVTHENRGYLRATGKLVLVAAVRRARSPGCKWDEMPILEGPQGCGKSTAVRILAGNDYFSDANLGDLTRKEAGMKLRGVWIQEMGELAAMRKADVDVLKEFLSQQSDHYRIPYAKFEDAFPRRCIFIGTVNPGGGAYLVDLTGNRRLWPVACGQIDLAALERDRDQLWAEAAMMESRGDSIRLDPSLYDAAKAEQDARLADDPWVERLARFLEELHPEPGKRVLSIDLLSVALEMPPERQGQLATKKLKTAMAQIETWQYKPSLRVDGVKSAGYEYVGKKSAL